MKKRSKMAAAAAAASAMIACSSAAVSAIDLGDILKGGAAVLGGGALVTAIAPQLDSFINTITLNRGAEYKGFTKVVPIISLGDGTHIGAAQIGGTTKADVDRTQAVAQLEGEWSRIRARALIPIDSLNPLQGFRRVQGVGVTAIIDVKI